MRKPSVKKFSTNSVKGFYETQMKEAIALACDSLDEPTRWNRHFRRTAASTTLSAVYGYPTLTSEQDHMVVAINDLSERLLNAIFMGARFVDFFPSLRYLPSRCVLLVRHNGLSLKL
jgi:hypothetical protein